MPWLTTEEAAEILDYHADYVRRLLREGILIGKKFGQIWLIDPGSVERRKSLLDDQAKQGFSKNDPRRGN